ncbi:MAG: fliJ [Massilia sp.]|nr:fliJ [Massilia sp.]
MSDQPHLIRNLASLVQLRSTEVERLEAEVAAKAAVCARYQSSVDRLTSLYAASGSSGALPLALSMNCGDYKQSVMQLVDTHRTDLSLHEADLAHTRRALHAAWARREALGKVLVNTQNAEQAERQRRGQLQQDEVATQLWMRGRP